MIFRMRFLGGRVYAGGGGATLPWPPEPGRLFAALVNGWGVSGRDPGEEHVLRELEKLPAPALHAPPLGDVTRYNSYVPPNELSRGQFARKRQVKTWVVAPILGEPVVHFHFADLPSELLPILDGLLAKASRFGSSRNPILLERVPDGPEPNYAPVERGSGNSEHPLGETIALRVFYPGFLDELESRFRTMHRRRGIPARYHPYRSLRTEPAHRPPFLLYPDLRIALSPALPLVFWPRMVEELRARTLAVARRVLRLPDDELHWLHGHAGKSEPVPPPHMALVPLAFVRDRWADGRVLGAAFLLPPGLGRERGQLAGVLWGLMSEALEMGPWKVGFGPPVGDRKGLSPARWTRRSHRWASVTPVVWDRHPKRGEEEAEVVRRMAEDAGLPAPVAHRAVPYSPLRGVPAARDFYLNGRWRGLVTHMVLEFRDPIPGPVLLGRGRHFGMGFFAPLDTGGA